jgi:hypothetical protein
MILLGDWTPMGVIGTTEIILGGACSTYGGKDVSSPKV